jgi:hypothetical protein
MAKKTKAEVLSKVAPKDYRIYGIFDFQKKMLIYVHMEQEQVELEFELSGYDDERYDIVEFFIRLI